MWQATQQSVQLNCYHEGMSLRCSRKWRDNRQCKKPFTRRMRLLSWCERWSLFGEAHVVECQQLPATDKCRTRPCAVVKIDVISEKRLQCSFIYQNIPIFKDMFLGKPYFTCYHKKSTRDKFSNPNKVFIRNNDRSRMRCFANEKTANYITW